MGFQHSNTEIWEDDTAAGNQSAQTTYRCNGPEATDCNNAVAGLFINSYHLTYTNVDMTNGASCGIDGLGSAVSSFTGLRKRDEQGNLLPDVPLSGEKLAQHQRAYQVKQKAVVNKFARIYASLGGLPASGQNTSASLNMTVMTGEQTTTTMNAAEMKPGNSSMTMENAAATFTVMGSKGVSFVVASLVAGFMVLI